MGNSTPHRPQSGGPVAHTACLSPFTLWDEDPKKMPFVDVDPHITHLTLLNSLYQIAYITHSHRVSLSKRHIPPLLSFLSLCNKVLFFSLITTCHLPTLSQPRVTTKRQPHFYSHYYDDCNYDYDDMTYEYIWSLLFITGCVIRWHVNLSYWE